MPGRSAISILLAVIITPMAGAETARGVVFEDVNGNGAYDAGEPGIANVAVSNAREVITTDANGRYSITVDAPGVVFITQPSGYQTPVNRWMLPRFYYLHQPQGSPTHYRYRGVEPTGPLPASIDFPLRRHSNPERFEALLFADTQPQSRAELDYIRDDVIGELVGAEARFGMTLGDIMFDDLSLFPQYLAIVAQLGVPWYNVPGNHEMNLDAPDDATSLETFKRYFGPPYYSFDVGRAHVVVLDNIDYQGNGETDPANYRGSGGYEKRFGPEQLRWLKNDLALVDNDNLVFLAMHAPLESYLSGPTEDRRGLFRLLEGRPHLYAVAGHTHTAEHHYFDSDDGFKGPGEFHHHVLATVSGSWWSGPNDARGIAVAEQRDGTPNGWYVLEVDGVDVTMRYQAAGQPTENQLRIVFDVAHQHYRDNTLLDFRHGELIDGRMSIDEVAAARVIVNLFDGGPKSRVFFSVAGRPEIALDHVAEADPYVLELYNRYRPEIKPWVQAEPSSHLWAADLPDDLGVGTWVLTVRAVDEFGRTHHGHRLLEIEGSPAGAPESVIWND